MAKGSARRRFWRDFFEGAPARALAAGSRSEAERAARALLAAPAAVNGHVALVGAGPGAEDLMTVRAQRLLMEADVIVYDALVPEAVVAMGRRDAERLPVGKRKGCHSKSQAEINAAAGGAGQGRQARRAVEIRRSAWCSAVPARRCRRCAMPASPTRSCRASPQRSPPPPISDCRSPCAAWPPRWCSPPAMTSRARPCPTGPGLAIAGATVAVYMGRSVAADVAGPADRSRPVAATPQSP